jgi:hypothetical protein
VRPNITAAPDPAAATPAVEADPAVDAWTSAPGSVRLILDDGTVVRPDDPELLERMTALARRLVAPPPPPS